MLAFFVALQIAAAPRYGFTPEDSVALVAHVRQQEFFYIMDWRHEWEMWHVDLAFTQQSVSRALSRLAAPDTVRRPAGRCNSAETIRTDLDPHEMMAHFVRAPIRDTFSLCPDWVSPVDTQPADDALGIDNPLTPEYRDTVRARRVPLLALLDSAAHVIPGDGWLAGQRVRMHVDQKETAMAFRSTTECRAAAWWCMALRGYVRFTVHDERGAGAAFDSARKRMPPDTLCRWDDIGPLLNTTARAAYQKLNCTDQDSVNKMVWWLADPLYLVPGNARRTEHYARLVLGKLHAGNDVDEREDMRDEYAGLAVQEMVLRYGWPTTMKWNPPRECKGNTTVRAGKLSTRVPGVCYYVTPPGWSVHDTKSTYLGLTGLTNNVMRARPAYTGPEYHTIPNWSAISDPFHAAASDWDLGPERQDTLYWDSSWWAPEFFQRYEGPLVDLSTQIGFVRRYSTAVVAAAMEWGIDPSILAPPTNAAVGVITSGGPDEKPRTSGVKMDGAHPRAILAPVESRPLLLGIEMVPENDSGPAGRTRFGILPPLPLRGLRPGLIAISDPILVRAAPGEAVPGTIQEVLPRMYGSTRLLNPKRIAVYWEVYGQKDGDTVDVALRIMRRGPKGILGLVGLGAASDSVALHWREPRAGGDALTIADSGIAIRPRGEAIDIAGLPAGDYALEIRIDRQGVEAVSAQRQFTIVRQ